MIALFKDELESNSRILESGLVELESNQSPVNVEPLMRAAHSIKGAARIIRLDVPVEMAHAMEDMLSAAQLGNYKMDSDDIDLLLECNDIFITLSKLEPMEIPVQLDADKDKINELARKIREYIVGNKPEKKPKKEESTRSELIEEFHEDHPEKILCDTIKKNGAFIEESLKTVSSGGKPDLEALEKATHQIKDAARDAHFDSIFDLSRAIEEVVLAVRKKRIFLVDAVVDVMLRANDIFSSLAELNSGEINDVLKESESIIEEYSFILQSALTQNVIEKEKIHKPQKENNQRVKDSEALVDPDMLEIFKNELDENSEKIKTWLNEKEKLGNMAKAADSIKGASKIVRFDSIAALARSLAEKLARANEDGLDLSEEQRELIDRINSVFSELSSVDTLNLLGWVEGQAEVIEDYCSTLDNFLNDEEEPETQEKVDETSENMEEEIIEEPEEIETEEKAEEIHDNAKDKASEEKTYEDDDRRVQLKKSSKPKTDSFVKVLAENLDKLMGLSGESLVQARSASKFSKRLTSLKTQLNELSALKEEIYEMLEAEKIFGELESRFRESTRKISEISNDVNSHIEEFELFSRKIENISEKLYNEAIATRMKPISEGLHGFSRMVRDIAKKLDKQVDFEIVGENTRVDKDILEKLESPLMHLIRNAIDHGLESPDEREKVGKPRKGKITLEARHSSGMLLVSVTDDGNGIDIEKIREKIIKNGHSTEEIASKLNAAEILEFLFLPGFSTAGKLTEISGRGVGLDVVFSMTSDVGGVIRAETEQGKSTSFIMQLPLTLSVVRALLARINGQAYALPISKIDRLLNLSDDEIITIENNQFCNIDGENVGIIPASQLFDLEQEEDKSNSHNIVIISDRMNRYGLKVDKLLGESDLVVMPLDYRLGKIPNISAGAIMEDGSPVLITDIEDIVRSIDKLLKHNKQKSIKHKVEMQRKLQKKILVVDDSITVRQVQRKILESKGYFVETAENGMEGWNVVRSEKYDLVISDIDMPRMNGIEFVTKIKQSPKLKDIPVIIVSYKDRESDRQMGLDAGANYYLTKSSFHDDTLINAVEDLIGKV